MNYLKENCRFINDNIVGTITKIAYWKRYPFTVEIENIDKNKKSYFTQCNVYNVTLMDEWPI